MNAYNKRIQEKSKDVFLELCEKENYKVLGNYINIYTKVLVRCRHGHMVNIIPRNFKTGQRCAKCAGNCKEEAKKSFLELCEKEGYIVLSSYINKFTKVQLRCVHGHIVNIAPGKFKIGRRCAKCAGNCKEEAKKKFDDLMKCNRYTALTNYRNSVARVLIRCNWCDKEFFAIPKKLYSNSSGCPRCAGRDKETAREKFYRKLILNDVQPLTDYVDVRTTVKVIHEKCGTIWDIRPNRFMYEDSNWCPVCKK
ncbi:hypothetical protein [Bacillus sp. FSL L8-0152]|uniref:hypothetical protein n=1 Tax=Bacillus sp. FSL L8-0152 TaxID=2921516 RepID=UPI0030F98BA9